MSWDLFEECLTPSTGPQTGVVVLGRWDAIGLQALDDAFVETFGSFGKSDVRIGSKTTKYRDRLTLLRERCKGAAQEMIERQKTGGIPEDVSLLVDVLDALAWPSEEGGEMIPLPFPTRSFLNWIFKLFASIPNAITEVCFPLVNERILSADVRR